MHLKTNNMTTIVSIDTGDPQIPFSTTAFVKVQFFNNGTITRSAMAYVGHHTGVVMGIIEFLKDTDYVVIEKIDSTNKYISRSIIAEQLSLKEFIEREGKKVHEMVRSGRKQIITDELLKKIGLFQEEGFITKHHDVREATRNLLYFMAKDKKLNLILSDYVQYFFK